MAGYGQFCPVALGAEVLATRWTPLIVRELLNGGIRFSGLPLISRNLLVQRLSTLEQVGIIESVDLRDARDAHRGLSRPHVVAGGIRVRRVSLAGSREACDAFPRWSGASPFAHIRAA